jgi:hypothetical protein
MVEEMGKRWSSVGRRAREGFRCCVLVLVGACASERKPVPLYPADEQPLESEIATLYGDVRDVDGKFVSEHGGTFALRSGCHVVGVVKTWGRMNDFSGVVANLPPIVFVMTMRGGYRYIVHVEARVDSGPTGTVTVKGTEEDAEGNVTREFPALQAGASCPSEGVARSE